MGYLFGYVLLSLIGLNWALFYSFLLTIIFIVPLIIFVNLMPDASATLFATFYLLCKITLSSAILLGFIGVALVFKPRVQGHTLGYCLALAYTITLFQPLITTSSQ